MRGKLNAELNKLEKERITPADAGKTELGVSQAGHGEDHPRGCGENPLLGGVAGFAPGSPPRMRGKH